MSNQVLYIHINIHYYGMLTTFSMNLHPSVSCLPSLQLTLPEGTQARFGHTLTACRMCPDRINTTTFGGCPKFVFGDDAKQKLSETTVMEFGEYNTH